MMNGLFLAAGISSGTFTLIYVALLVFFFLFRLVRRQRHAQK